MTGFWNLLTDEQKARARAYDGPEAFGAVEFLRKKEVDSMAKTAKAQKASKVKLVKAKIKHLRKKGGK